MKLLVTGGAGFIGTNFIKYWLEKHPADDIVNFDKLTYAGNLENLKELENNTHYKFIKGDVADPDDVRIAIQGIDVVVHFAAESITENTYIPVNSAIGTRTLTFKELWEQQTINNDVKKTNRGEVVFLKGKQTKVLSFLNGGQWMPIRAITRHWYKGKIVKLIQKWGIIETTPNHSIYSSSLELVNSEENPEILVVREINEHKRKLNSVNKKILEIMAAYVTEGNATFNQANGGYIVEIGQKDRRWLEDIGKTIKERFDCSFNVMKRKKGEFIWFRMQISNKKFYEYVINSCGKYCDQKFFPNWIFDLSPQNREYFWKKLLEGDGTTDGRYTTTSNKLANQISLLLTLQKKKFVVFERNNPKYKRSFEFKTVSDGSHYGLNRRKKLEINYEGWVYDVEVEKTHNFVCGIGNVVCHNTHVDRSILAPAAFIKSNVLGTQVLLDAAVENKIKRFHHISTDEVFGSLKLESHDKFNENTPYDPHSPYSASKAASDHLARAYFHTYRLPVTISNCSNNFGPYHFPEKLIPLAITNLLEDKKIPVYGDGKYARDWLYVTDHCRAIDLILKKGVIGETYLIGGMTDGISNLAIIQLICELMGKDFGRSIEFVKDRPGHDRRYAVDWTKIKNKLGWKPEHDFKDWLKKTVEWYKNNQAWWKKVKSGEYQEYYQKQYGGLRNF